MQGLSWVLSVEYLRSPTSQWQGLDILDPQTQIAQGETGLRDWVNEVGCCGPEDL